MKTVQLTVWCGSDPAEARHARDLRFVYDAVRSPAPRWRDVLVVRGDRSSPRGVHPRSAPVHDFAVSGGWTKPRWLVRMRPTAKRGGPCNKPSRRRRDGLGTSLWPASSPISGGALTRWYWTNSAHGHLPQQRAWTLGSWRRLPASCSRERRTRKMAGSPMRSLIRRRKSHVTLWEVGARNRGSPRKNCPRLSGESERGKLRVPTESRPVCGRTSPGSCHAVTSFCEQVILRKEAAERVRVGNSHPERIGRRGRGRGRGRFSTRRARSAMLSGGAQT